MKKVFIACILLSCFSLVNMAETKKVTIRLVETTDVHGCFFPFDYIDNKPMKGSMARVSSYVNNIRKDKSNNLILIDNGDIMQGQPTCFYYNYVKTDIPNVASAVLNYMKYDVATMGNHDVETGHKVYDKWISELQCDVLGANIIDNKTRKPYLKPYKIIEREGVRVAILGMITPAIPNWLSEDLWHGLSFESIKKSTTQWLTHIKKHERADVIVGAFHSGWNGGISTIHFNEDETMDIAKNIDGFDIIFFGHDHTQRDTTIINDMGHRVICLDPSSFAHKVADACVTVEMKDGVVVNKNTTGSVVDITSQPIDKEMCESLKEYTDGVKQYVNTVVTTFAEPIYTRDCFFGNAPFADLVHNIMLSCSDADISFNAPLSFDAEIKKGVVNIGKMFDIYRYENQLFVLRMTGEEVRKHLEMSYCQWVNTMKSPSDHIMLLNSDNIIDQQRYGFKNLTFNFDSAAGIDYIVDVTKPDGQKVKILRMSDGSPFSETKWYKVVMNSYRGNGGGELLTRGAGIAKDSLESRIIYKSEKPIRDIIIDELSKTKVVNPKANDNWRFVPESITIPAIKRDRKLIFH